MKEFIEKLIGRLEEHSFSLVIDWEKGKYLRKDKAIEIVNELAKEHKGGWIPCSKRLPEKDGKQYMVQMTNGLIDILRFTKDAYKLDKYDFKQYKGKKKQLFFEYDSEYGFIERECEAWQPLPEPYQAPATEKTHKK